jgi:hypothetical protein
MKEKKIKLSKLILKTTIIKRNPKQTKKKQVRKVCEEKKK